MSGVIIGNAIDYALAKSNRVLLHCVNAQGKYASGIAKEIRQRIPEAYEAYMDYHELGDVSYTRDNKVINLCAQEFYGNDGKKYVSYKALQSCLECIKFWLYRAVDNSTPKEFVVPYGMCAGLAGGDFEAVQVIVELVLGRDNVTYVKLP